MVAIMLRIHHHFGEARREDRARYELDRIIYGETIWREFSSHAINKLGSGTAAAEI